MPKKKGGLGRGLDVFFGDDDHPGILRMIEVPSSLKFPSRKFVPVAINRARRWMKRL